MQTHILSTQKGTCSVKSKTKYSASLTNMRRSRKCRGWLTMLSSSKLRQKKATWMEKKAKYSEKHSKLRWTRSWWSMKTSHATWRNRRARGGLTQNWLNRRWLTMVKEQLLSITYTTEQYWRWKEAWPTCTVWHRINICSIKVKAVTKIW